MNVNCESIGKKALPSGWRLIRLGEVCGIKNGYAFESSGFCADGGIPLIRIRDLKTNSPSACYSGPYDDVYLIRPGALLVGMDGEFICYKWEGPASLLNQRICQLLPNETIVDTDFLHYSLQDYLSEIESNTASTTVKHISSHQIMGILLLLPPLAEQKRIAGILNERMPRIDKARAAAEAQLESIRTLPNAYYRDSFGDIIPLSVGLKARKEKPGWKWRILREVARLESGHTPSRYHPEWWGGDIHWLALPDIRSLNGRYAYQTSEETNPDGIENSAARILPAGTVCLSRTASVGFVTIIGKPMATSQDFVNWVCGPEIYPEFLMHIFLYARDFFVSLASGAIHKTVYMPTVEQLCVHIPDLITQKTIADELNRLRTSADFLEVKLKEQLNEISALPQALLRQAFIGEL